MKFHPPIPPQQSTSNHSVFSPQQTTSNHSAINRSVSFLQQSTSNRSAFSLPPLRRSASNVRRWVPLFLLLLTSPLTTFAAGRTSNGNDFALYLIETRNPAEEKTLVEDAVGRPHFFRYLQIMEMEEIHENDTKGYRIKAFEPASYMDVSFSVTRTASLRTLREDPVTVLGSAIAVTGKVVAADKASNTIQLGSVIVRHKDRLSPARGKELLCEVDPRALFYSYAGGSRPVGITYKDRDLLQHKGRILKERGKQGWADFLAAEVTKRNAARAAEKKK